MRKLVLLAGFFLSTPLVLIFSLLLLLTISYEKDRQTLSISPFQKQEGVAYAALPSQFYSVQQKILSGDVRVEAVRQFFANYKSPLVPQASFVVRMADKYKIDYRLIPAIAMQESNLCQKILKNSYNCWGYAIYGKHKKTFKNYETAIEAVTYTLAHDYKKDRGLVTPEEIAGRYTSASSKERWAKSVAYFMDELRTLAL
jgi:hypothetical protein